MTITDYLPYIVSVLCALIAGSFSYFGARRQAKTEIAKLDKQYSNDLERERECAKLELAREREKNRMELQKLQLQHQHEMELKEKELENAMGESVVNTLFSEMMKMPEIQHAFSNSIKMSRKGNKQNKAPSPAR